MWMQANPGRIGSTIPGYEWTATPAPRSSMAVGEMRPLIEPRWLAGVGAALGVALAFAVLHASFAVATDWLLGWYLTFVLGLAVGATLKKVGRVSGAGPGLLGALIAVLGWALTVLFALAGIAAKLLGVAFFPMLQALMSEWGEVLSMYFQESPTQYLAALAAAVGGFIGANAGFTPRGRR